MWKQNLNESVTFYFSLHAWVDRARTMQLAYHFMRRTVMCVFARKDTRGGTVKQVRRGFVVVVVVVIVVVVILILKWCTEKRWAKQLDLYLSSQLCRTKVQNSRIPIPRSFWGIENCLEKFGASRNPGRAEITRKCYSRLMRIGSKNRDSAVSLNHNLCMTLKIKFPWPTTVLIKTV